MDITLLRTGPDRLPRSWQVFFAMLAASLIVSTVTSLIVVPGAVPMYDVTLLLTVINVSFYFAVLTIAGFPERAVQSLSAILGVDAVLTAVYVGAFLVLGIFMTKETASSIAWLLSCWSVAVEGHIISRALGRHRVVGIAIAIVAYSLLLLTYLQFADLP